MPSKFVLVSWDDGLPPLGIGGGPSTPPMYPSHGLPPGAVQLPVFPFDPTVPDNTLPSGGGRPDNTLPPGVDNTLPGGSGGHPSGQPIVPGKRFIVKWLACTGLILVPDHTLPPTAEPK